MAVGWAEGAGERAAPRRTPLWPFLLLALLVNGSALMLPCPRWGEPSVAMPQLRISLQLVQRSAAQPAESIPESHIEPIVPAVDIPEAIEPPPPPIRAPVKESATTPAKKPTVARPSPTRKPAEHSKQAPTPVTSAAGSPHPPAGAELAERALASIRTGAIELAPPPADLSTELEARIAPPTSGSPYSERYTDPYGKTQVTVRASDGSVTCFEITEVEGLGDDTFPLWVRKKC